MSVLADINKWLGINNSKETGSPPKKKQLSFETMKSIVKLIQEGNPQWSGVRRWLFPVSCV